MLLCLIHLALSLGESLSLEIDPAAQEVYDEYADLMEGVVFKKHASKKVRT